MTRAVRKWSDSAIVRRICSPSRFFLVRLLLFSTFRHFAFHSVNTFFFAFFSLKIEAKEKVRKTRKRSQNEAAAEKSPHFSTSPGVGGFRTRPKRPPGSASAGEMGTQREADTSLTIIHYFYILFCFCLRYFWGKQFFANSTTPRLRLSLLIHQQHTDCSSLDAIAANLFILPSSQSLFFSNLAIFTLDSDRPRLDDFAAAHMLLTSCSHLRFGFHLF